MPPVLEDTDKLMQGVEQDVLRRMNPPLSPLEQGMTFALLLVVSVLWGEVVKAQFLR